MSNRATSTLHELLPCKEVLQRKAGSSKVFSASDGLREQTKQPGKNFRKLPSER